MPTKIALISLGCSKNLVDSERMLYLIHEAGFETASSPQGADAAIVNTCGFIDSAKAEAIDTILELAALKKSGQLGKIIVAGCMAQRYKDDVLKELPEADAVMGIGSCGDVVSVIRGVLGGETVRAFGRPDSDWERGGRVVSTEPGSAYLKIADGCDNRCAYCAIPGIRGPFRSRPMEDILDEAKTLAQSGVRELILVAQDTTRYGLDLYGEKRLAPLCRALCEIPELGWLRLHYLYPEAIDEALIDVVATEPKIVKYLDIPIQHINNGILKAMNRRGSGDMIRSLFKTLRQRIGGLVLRTSLIAGLPGEGEAEFQELCEFLREQRIERCGVFAYSPEEDTPAAEMPNRPDEEMARLRADQIMDFQQQVMDQWNEARVGQTLRVLCIGQDEESGLWRGRTYADSPEIDGQVLFSGQAAPGEFVDVKITAVIDADLSGETV